MSDHVLIRFATCKPYRDRPDLPADVVYDFDHGYWIKNGVPLVTLDSCNPPMSKKFDIETGEDQKGE